MFESRVCRGGLLSFEKPLGCSDDGEGSVDTVLGLLPTHPGKSEEGASSFTHDLSVVSGFMTSVTLLSQLTSHCDRPVLSHTVLLSCRVASRPADCRTQLVLDCVERVYSSVYKEQLRSASR